MLNPRLKDILLKAFLLDDIKFEDSIETIALWDSMRHIEIMLQIEHEYGIVLNPEEIIQLTSVQAIQQLLQERGLL